MENFLSAGDLIIAKLQTILTSVPERNIRPAPSIDWAIANKLDNSISVIFFDDVPETGAAGEARRGKSQLSKQFWLLLIAKRNVADAAGSAARTDAGPIMAATLKALQGWPPSSEHGPLYRERSPYRATDRDGFVFIPLLFSTRITTTGAG